jgi:lysyl-tRNA synthetase class 2
MSKQSTNNDSKDSTGSISYSSIETQRKLRIEKLEKIKELGHNPYTPYSQRDFTLGFIRFWFDYVHKFDYDSILEEDEELYAYDHFLHQVLFPRTLLETMEERLHLRNTVRQIGLDPDEEEHSFDEEFDKDMVDEARGYFPQLFDMSEQERMDLLRSYLEYTSGEDDFGYGDLAITFGKHQKVTLAGRIKSKRMSGKIGFASVEDESNPDGFQFIFKKDDLPKEATSESLSFSEFKNLIDEGDYIQAKGILDYSQRGEPSLFVEEFKILTKSLRPLPDMLSYDNVEERFTNRVVDFKMNTEDDNGLSVRKMMEYKAKFWSIWREELNNEGFLEVECPVFEHIPGGANAKPFTTYYDLLDQEMYLRISLELPLKKLIAGGFEKVYEIGRIFRNEGASPQHLQEYTQLEYYWAYSDYHTAMDFVSRVYRRIVQEILGKLTQIDYYGNEINWGDWMSSEEAQKNGWKLVNGWPAIPYFEAIKYYSEDNIDLEGKSVEELKKIAQKNDVDVEDSVSYGNLLDKIYKKVARPNIINPVFLIKQPVELEPLAKRDPEDTRYVHRWQIVAGTAELGKAFSELNDPIDQFGRFQEQQEARDSGDDEAQFMDKQYIEAMELGMPPLSGYGISERLLSFILGKNIKELVTFPAVRSQDKKSTETKTEKQEQEESEIPRTAIDNLNVGQTRLVCLEDNTYLFKHKGKVIEVGESEGKSYVILDETIFYPQGGGQPSDTGTIQSKDTTFEVSKCMIIDDKVLHFGEFSKKEFKSGDKVDIEIDEAKRRLLARIHSAGHVLDLALENLGIRLESNKGYHFPEGPYVEYKGELEVTDEVIEQIQAEANRIIDVNPKISYTIFNSKHANGKPERIMHIEGYPSCPCGGTHVRNLKEIGTFILRKIKNKKGLVKVSYTVE